MWNLFFVFGIAAGAFLAVTFLSNHQPINVNPKLVSELKDYGINDYSKLAPPDIFNWSSLFTVKGFVLMVAGGFLDRFWNEICRRMHVGTFNNGFIQFTMAIIGGHYLFYDRWNSNGKFYSAIHFTALIFCMEEIAK